MSGQYPAHQHQVPPGGAPGTNSTWSHSSQQQPQGSSMSPGIPQSAGYRALPQPHISPFGQVPPSPSKAMKFPNVTHNGAGEHLSASVSNQNQTNLSQNLRNNFHMYVNQGPGQASKISNFNPVTRSSTSGGSLGLPQALRSAENSPSESIPSVPQIVNKEPLLSQNSNLAPSSGPSGPFNGEGHSRTSSVISVISNATVSPLKRMSGQTLSEQFDSRGNELVRDEKTRLPVTENSVIKKEQVRDGEMILTCGVISEPSPKKFKEEESVDSTVIVDSSNSSTSMSKNIPEVSVGFKEVKLNPPSNLPPTSLNSSGKQDVLDVESQLEALFAGIGDDGNSCKETKPITESSSPHIEGTPNIAAVLESKGSSSKKGKGRTNGISSVLATSSGESSPRKKRKKRPAKDKPWEESKSKKSKKGGASKGKYLKEVSCDSGSNASSSRARGPVIHLEGPKEAPTSFSVVNAPARQDDEDNDSKKKVLSSSRGRKGHTIEGKLSSTGLCGNSLVSRYETHSSDPRWVCVFCKRGCHAEGLGDLFGPYLVNHDTELENSLEVDTLADRKNGEKKDKKNKRSGMGQTGVLGLLAIPPLVGEQPQFMVWFHENCAVWSPTINLIGSRLAGLQEAVWVALHSKCSRCLIDGANIGCVQHGCSRQIHYPCARDESWCLDDDTFISTCSIHKKLDPTVGAKGNLS